MLSAPSSRVISLIAALGAFSCGSKASSPNECSVNVPTSCPDASLSYAAGVGDTFETTCSQCHAPGGVESTVPLTNYNEVSKRLTSVAGQLETCTMPPAGSPPISASDRQAILDWIACGAPP
jgi:cytochrome c5